MDRHTEPLAIIAVSIAVLVGTGARLPEALGHDDVDFGAVFDEHWERLRDEYPYFDRYGVDWEGERADHRPRAVAARNATEFAWEIARLLSVLQDSHVGFIPPPDLLAEWSMPTLRTALIERKPHVLDWGDGPAPVPPIQFAGDGHVYPEIVAVEGVPFGCGVEILAAGPPGTSVTLQLRWPDGTETTFEVPRPDVSNVPPPQKHFGERWIVSGRVGSVGYIRVKTFDPSQGTLGPSGKMTPILRRHLKGLMDTEGMILDFQANGGGLVGASDPFLGHFLERRRSYAWGRSGGRSRVLIPRSPRYRGPVVALVDEKSASGGEWAARILRDAGRAMVVGGPSRGAEAAVHTSLGSDGSKIVYSAWPMVEPGVTPFQDRGVDLDFPFPLAIDDVREHGYDEAVRRVRRARLAKALEILTGSTDDLEALITLSAQADNED